MLFEKRTITIVLIFTVLFFGCLNPTQNQNTTTGNISKNESNGTSTTSTAEPPPTNNQTSEDTVTNYAPPKNTDISRLYGTVMQVDLSTLPVDVTDYTSYRPYYVATTGNDDNDGTLQQPFATIEHALEVATEGDAVFIRGGTYKSNILLITQSNFVLAAYNNEQVTLTQLSTNPEWDWNEDTAIQIDGGTQNIVVDGLTIAGFTQGIIYGDPQTQKNLRFKNIKLKDGDSGIGNNYPEHSAYLVDGLLIKNVVMENMTGIGINCGDEVNSCARNVLIQDVQVRGKVNPNDDTGVDTLAMVKSDNILVLDSIFANAPGDGLDFKSTRVAVVNTKAVNPTRNGIKFWHDGEIINCLVYGTGADAAIVFESPESGTNFRMINSVIAQHNIRVPDAERSSYAMTLNYDTPTSQTSIEMKNNIIYDMPGPIYINGQSSVDIQNNIFYRFINGDALFEYADEFIGIDALNSKSYANENKYTDPKFVNPGQGDFTLMSGSPALDSGLTEERIPKFDINWKSRPQGSGIDLGPHEK